MNEKKLSYWEKLKDPRWQRMRAEVLAENDYTCEVCGDTETTLHVHHREYFIGNDPWEYDKKQLAVLCELCHERFHYSDQLKWVCSYLDMDGHAGRNNASVILAGFSGMDYQGFLEYTSAEDSDHTRRLYECGMNAQIILNKAP